jgi:HAE1 family hydrophobic/amphiphilic exporter-1
MYVILGITYESYIHPITVLSALPVAIVGGLLTVILFRMELSLYGYIGLFMLIGIVKKKGILVIDFAIARQRESMDTKKAIHTAFMERFRPFIMTTLAALIGQVPIAIGVGADGASRMSLGLSIIGGLIVSQIITLYITPVIYLRLEDFQKKVLDNSPFFARELRE